MMAATRAREPGANQASALPGAGEVAERLARTINELAPQLLSAGRRSGNYWVCGSVENERGSSLFIHLTGPRAGRWSDAATGEFGDALDLVAATQFRGDRKHAYRWSLDRLGLARGMAVPPVQKPAPAARAAATDDDDARRRRAALRMWLEAVPALAGTPAGLYLAARGLDLSQLGRQPRSLRCHASLPHRSSGRNFPALVAAISDAEGAHIATHRTWLQPDRTGVWRKARVEDPKMSFGNFAGGCIRIWRGASGKPLRDAPPDDDVVLAEGIETALSIALAVPEFRVLAAVSLGNMGAVVLPLQLRKIVLAADNDAKPKARAQFQRAVERHLAAGRQVRVARAEIGKDFNDTLVGWAG